MENENAEELSSGINLLNYDMERLISQLTKEIHNILSQNDYESSNKFWSCLFLFPSQKVLLNLY